MNPNLTCVDSKSCDLYKSIPFNYDTLGVTKQWCIFLHSHDVMNIFVLHHSNQRVKSCCLEGTFSIKIFKGYVHFQEPLQTLSTHKTPRHSAWCQCHKVSPPTPPPLSPSSLYCKWNNYVLWGWYSHGGGGREGTKPRLYTRDRRCENLCGFETLLKVFMQRRMYVFVIGDFLNPWTVFEASFNLIGFFGCTL